MSNTPQRRRRQPTARSSSFLGAIKTIVTAPFSWFSAEAPQNGAKRKQQSAPSPYDVIHSDDDEDQSSDYGSSRVKRMRLDSPPASQPYLDPPVSAFPHSLPTLPPSNPSRRNLSRDVSMATPEDSAPFPISRDRSMPAIPSKSSSFRMRTSLTPQPSGPNFGPTVRRLERDASEPPPLTSLMTNPIFVRAPSEQHVAPSRPSTTLGTLASSRRISRSHSRNSLFGSQPPPNSAPVQVSNAAEQALHELEIYKTPLLPTRLRGSSGIPEMFKQRKHPPIVLMREHDEKGRLGKSRRSKKQKEEVVNESKPYAGAGGMKKLLAKIREEDGATEETSPKKEVHQSPERPRSPPKVAPTIEPPPLTEPFRVEPRPSTHSSLRVGRNKQNRSHAQSVTRPSKNRFSAVYDEDDGMDEDDGERQKEQQMLEEAAKKAPVFNIPANFTFANDASPLAQPSVAVDAKEPPLTSLPFSFAKPMASPERSAAPSPPSVRPAVPTPTPAPAPLTPAFSFNTPPVQSPAATKENVEEPPKSTSAIPNFFASSTSVKPLSTPPPPKNMFGLSSTPVVDTSSPFWGSKTKEPETKEVTPPAPAPTFGGFGGFGAPTSASAFGATSSSTSLFGAQAPKDTATTKESETPKPFFAPAEPPKPTEAPAPTPSLFGAPSTTTTSAPTFTFGAPQPKESSAPEPKVEESKPAATTGFSFGQPAATTVIEAPKPIFGGSAPAFTFGQAPPKPADAPKPEEKPASPFSFGAPPATPPAANKGLTFGGAPPSPFTFGTPSAASAAPEPKSGFTFGALSTPIRAGSPPRNNDSEMNMDESPTRDLQAPIAAAPAFASKPVISTGFTFGTSNDGALFGTSATPTSASSPFGFGNSSTNPFGATKPEVKVEDKPASTGFIFGQANQDSAKPASTGFSFGQKTEEKPASTGFSFGQQQQPQPSTIGGPFSFGSGTSDPPRPSTTGSFSFGSPSVPQPLQLSTSTGSQFSFGQSGSAPSSPAPFHQTPAFAFGAPTSATSTSNPFAFGSSQPASPATSNSGLPASGTGFSFGGGGSSPAPSFTPSTPTSTGGGNVFTIGSSANPPPPANGQRVTRRLPTRRGGKR